jgi:DNA-binding SARP family transcriptional activator
MQSQGLTRQPTPDGPPDASQLRLRLLGGFSLTQRERPITLPVSVQRVLAFLALQQQPLRRTYIAGSLWPDTSQRRAGGNLRSTLWRLRTRDLRVVASTNSYLALAGELSVDAREVAARVRRLVDRRAACQGDDLDMAPLAGELLPDWTTEDWLVVERERFRQLCLHGLEAICLRLQALERHGEAIEAGLAAVREEPLRESAHRALIRAHLAEGNQHEALRQYWWYERILREELGVAPSPELTGLLNGMRRSRLGAPIA